MEKMQKKVEIGVNCSVKNRVLKSIDMYCRCFVLGLVENGTKEQR